MCVCTHRYKICVCLSVCLYICIKYLLSLLSLYEYLTRVEITAVIFLPFLKLRGRLSLFHFIEKKKKGEGQRKDLRWESIVP